MRFSFARPRTARIAMNMFAIDAIDSLLWGSIGAGIVSRESTTVNDVASVRVGREVVVDMMQRSMKVQGTVCYERVVDRVVDVNG